MASRHRSLVLAGVWLFLVFVGAVTLQHFFTQSLFGGLVWLLVLPVVWKIGRRAADDWREARREQLLEQGGISDPRPPVVYLRSFSDEGRIPDDSFFLLFLELAAPGNWLAAALRPDKSQEQILTAALRKVGPVVALAKPGEELPELGATRLTAANSEWQARIEGLLAACNFVIFNIGYYSATKGLWWEFEKARALLPLSQIVLFLELEETDRAVRQIRYTRLKARMEPILAASLPPRIGRKSIVYFNRNGPQVARSIRAVLADRRNEAAFNPVA